jgi:general secretion pathway protein J
MNLSPQQRAVPPARPQLPGFTLVELLVAFALFALISVIMAGGLRFGVRAWEAGRERADPTNEVELAQTLLRRELGQAAVQLDEADGDRAFTGFENSLTFTGPLPAAAAAGQPYAFTLLATSEGDRKDLTLQWRPATAALAAGGGDQSAAVLLQDIAGFELAYFGSSASNEPPFWSSRWSGQFGLPRLVRLRVVFSPGDRRLWPDLFVAPRHEWRP